jgi:signal transduction histidine kinase
MKGVGAGRFLLFGILSTLIFSTLSLLCLAQYSSVMNQRRQEEFQRFVSETVELTVSELGRFDLRAPAFKDKLKTILSRLRSPRPGPTQPQPPPAPRGLRRVPLPRPQLWLVDSSGEVLSSSGDHPLPAEWAELGRPLRARETSSTSVLLNLRSRIYVTRLEAPEALYLVSLDDSTPWRGPMFVTQAVLLFGTLTVALGLSFALLFFYLRGKSLEAREVLGRMERGDLKARFQIRRFDQFGGLLLDFNRMADEIERLVSQVRSTESARKNLLRELGHDLRTPLTSLTTSFETLHVHYDRLSVAERRELFEMVGAEVVYIKDLIEKLMLIAGLDEPNYKKSTDVIDLRELLAPEIAARQSSDGRDLTWRFEDGGPARVLGDAHLLLRLFKNAFDNASRFARQVVGVRVRLIDGMAQVEITDDGPGLTATERESFARRREQRLRREGAELNFSLGLGSVIMKTIAELHGGSLDIGNAPAGGAVLRVNLPLS